MNQRLVTVLLVAALIVQASCRPKSLEDVSEIAGTDAQIPGMHTREPNGNCCVTIHRCCSIPKKHHKNHGSSASEAPNDTQDTEREANNDGLSYEFSSQGNVKQNYSNDQSSVQAISSRENSQTKRNYSSCCGNSNRCCSRRNKRKNHNKHHRPSTKAPNSPEGEVGSNSLSDESSSQEIKSQNSNSNDQPSETIVPSANSHTRRNYSPCCGNRCCARQDKRKKHSKHHRPSTEAPCSTEKPADLVQDVITQDLPNTSSSRNNSSQNTDSESQPSVGSVVPKNGSQDISNHQNSESNLSSQIAETNKDMDHSSQISSNNQSSSGFSANNQNLMNVGNQKTFSNRSTSELAVNNKDLLNISS